MLTDGQDHDVEGGEAALGQGQVHVLAHGHDEVLLHLGGGEAEPAGPGSRLPLHLLHTGRYRIISLNLHEPAYYHYSKIGT